MTARACAPEPRMRGAHGDRLAGFRLPVGGEDLVDLAIKLPRRIVGDVEKFRLRAGGAADGDDRGGRDEEDAEPAQRARRRLRLELREQAGEQTSLRHGTLRVRFGMGGKDEAEAGGIGRLPVDEDEARGLALRAVGIEGEGAVERQHDRADVVRAKRARRRAVAAVGIDALADRLDGRGNGGGAELQREDRALAERPVPRPEHAGREPLGDGRRRARRRDDIAAGRVEGIGEDERHRLSGLRRGKVAVEGCDPGHGAVAAGRQHADAVADAHDAAGDQTRKAAKAVIGPVHPLHCHPERQSRGAAAGLGALEILQQREAAVPGRRDGR